MGRGGERIGEEEDYCIRGEKEPEGKREGAREESEVGGEGEGEGVRKARRMIT